MFTKLPNYVMEETHEANQNIYIYKRCKWNLEKEINAWNTSTFAHKI